MSKWPGDATKERTRFGRLSRSELMGRVRSNGNATTETRLLRLLKAARLSGWRRHQPLEGRPDFVWRSCRLAVFVDGCFWHGHACGRDLTPRTNASAWRLKFRRNKIRDRRVTLALRRQGWMVVRIPECRLAANPERCLKQIRHRLERENR
jgi:DNA mismatch endonuclease (patch repair protein)